MSGKCREKGLTILELAIATALLTLVLSAAFLVFLKASRALETQVKQSVLIQSGKRVQERLGRELRYADPSTVSPALLNDSETISFRQVTGYSGGAVQLGPTLQFELQLESGETANGLDDNGDGRADEGFIRYRIGTDPWIVLARNILDLRLNAVTGGVTLDFDVGLIDRESGDLLRASFSERIQFRN